MSLGIRLGAIAHIKSLKAIRKLRLGVCLVIVLSI